MMCTLYIKYFEVVRHVKFSKNFNFPFFFAVSLLWVDLAMEAKTPQLHALIDLHSDFDQAVHWVPATHTPPTFASLYNHRLFHCYTY